MINLRQKNPFKIPERYFDELEDQICNSEDLISKLNPFSSPEEYFENLESSVLKTIKISNSSNKKTSKNLILQFTSLAAAILLIASIFQISTTEKIKKDQALNDFIENYYLEDFDSYEMLTMMEENVKFNINQVAKP
jgi:mannose/fructose/N-acetylgalactosamine-specific phosphotransferase system component IIB